MNKRERAIQILNALLDSCSLGINYIEATQRALKDLENNTRFKKDIFEAPLDKIQYPMYYNSLFHTLKAFNHFVSESDALFSPEFLEEHGELPLPIFGVLPTSDIYAAVHDNSDRAERIILISNGFVRFAVDMCTLVANCFPTQYNKNTIAEDVFDNIFANNSINIFYKLIFIYAITDQYEGILSRQIIERQELLLQLYCGYYGFVVAHEYAHYLVDDFNEKEDKFEQEMMADSMGSFLASNVFEQETEMNGIYCMSGINICLYSYAAIELISKFLNKKLDENYFPAMYRKDRIWRSIKSKGEMIDRRYHMPYYFETLLSLFVPIARRFLNWVNENNNATHAQLESAIDDACNDTLKWLNENDFNKYRLRVISKLSSEAYFFDEVLTLFRE